MSVYGAEHVERLRQVQQARSRGASLRLLRTLIAEGRDLNGVWDAGPPGDMVDVSDAALAAAHTATAWAAAGCPSRRCSRPGAGDGRRPRGAARSGAGSPSSAP